MILQCKHCVVLLSLINPAPDNTIRIPTVTISLQVQILPQPCRGGYCSKGSHSVSNASYLVQQARTASIDRTTLDITIYSVYCKNMGLTTQIWNCRHFSLCRCKNILVIRIVLSLPMTFLYWERTVTNVILYRGEGGWPIVSAVDRYIFFYT